MNSTTENNPELIAFCGLYCAACSKYKKGKCVGCQKIESPHWCKIRLCCIENKFRSCAECTLATPNDCKKFNNPISKIFKFIFKSDREACIMNIREKGYVFYAESMAARNEMALKTKKKVN